MAKRIAVRTSAGKAEYLAKELYVRLAQWSLSREGSRYIISLKRPKEEFEEEFLRVCGDVVMVTAKGWIFKRVYIRVDLFEDVQAGLDNVLQWEDV